MKGNADKLNAWYGLQICSNDEWISISNYETLEAARKAVRVRTENYKGEKLRIVKITVTMEVVE